MPISDFQIGNDKAQCELLVGSDVFNGYRLVMALLVLFCNPSHLLCLERINLHTVPYIHVSAIQWKFFFKFSQHFKGVKLKDPPALQNYDKTGNKGVMGTFETNITVKGKTIPACVDTRNLFWESQKSTSYGYSSTYDKMEINIPEPSRAVRSVILTEESIRTEYPKLFSSEVEKTSGNRTYGKDSTRRPKEPYSDLEIGSE